MDFRALLALSLAAASLAGLAEGQCSKFFQGSYCPSALGVDSEGCCSDTFYECCDIPGGRSYCNEPLFGGPCGGCGSGASKCTSQIQGSICIDKAELCNGECCLDDFGSKGPCCDGVCCLGGGSSGPCCSGDCCKDSAGRNKPCCNGQCCASVDSVCTSNGCAHKCNWGNVTTYCPESKVCCRGKCVDPVNGDPTLPCNGLCCDLALAGASPTTPTLKKNGWCCNKTCCTGSEKCCRGPDGAGCGTKCGTKCCRKGAKCCGGRCVSDQVYCGGLCCIGSKGQPAACCTNPKTGKKACC